MCHDVASQRKVVDEDYVRVLVDALDPNHDPVSFCCKPRRVVNSVVSVCPFVCCHSNF